ncbi:MAG: hypothetical protein LBG59_06305 [Candidatus Peribacteria bacterium]|nr:hypothetical protein [Candidatus Peribacteria bacterium]
MVSAVIFITTLLIGGTLVIFALNSNGLDSFRSGTNGNTLTANNRNDLITYVQVHDTVLGALLLQLNATFSGMQ